MVLGAAFAAAPRVVLAQQHPLETLRLASAPDDDVTPALYAEQAGLFRREGLDVRIQASNSGAAVAAAVAGGSMDIGKSSVMALISAHRRGLPFVIIAPAAIYTSDDPVVSMLVAKDSSIQSPRDLNGKTIAVPALGDLYAIANDAFVDRNGGDSKTIRYLEMPTSASPQAIIEKRVDAATMTTPLLVSALDSGKLRVLGHPFDAISKRFIQAAWFTTRDFLQKNRDVVDRFQAVMRAASDYANTHHAQTAPALAAFTKLDPKMIARMPRTSFGGPLDPALLQPVIEIAARYKAIPVAFDARAMVDSAAASSG
jgi:NitT/TauT family transport system substrate-binding protein